MKNVIQNFKGYVLALRYFSTELITPGINFVTVKLSVDQKMSHVNILRRFGINSNS